jgi:hypothetical protein
MCGLLACFACFVSFVDAFLLYGTELEVDLPYIM